MKVCFLAVMFRNPQNKSQVVLVFSKRTFKMHFYLEFVNIIVYYSGRVTGHNEY